MKLYAYNAGSQSAKNLAKGLNILRIKEEGGVLNIPGHNVINWGASEMKRAIVPKRVFNVPANVKLASNKLLAFDAFAKAEVRTVPFTRYANEALEWLQEGAKVVARTVLNGHSGAGIVICEKAADMVDAALYTKYIGKNAEYRVHVAFGKVIHVQRKVRNKEIPDEQINWQVRNHANGFIYQIGNIDIPDHVNQQAIQSVKALGLDFGAVDVMQAFAGDKGWYVLEVNTAPGLEGTTLERYIEAFKGL